MSVLKKKIFRGKFLGLFDFDCYDWLEQSYFIIMYLND